MKKRFNKFPEKYRTKESVMEDDFKSSSLNSDMD
jgi:hypothetical protein